MELVAPWVMLAFGMSVSFLIGLIAYFALLQRRHAIVVDSINQALKKEIQERKQALDYQEKLMQTMHQGQKMQAIGTLAGGIAHDFNNLLYAMIGYIEMAREDVSPNNTIYNNLGKVLEAAHKGQDLVARILIFSRNENQDQAFQKLELNATIEMALSFLRLTIPASVRIRFLKSEALFIEGNQNQIHQVLVNLINNAVDAMDGMGDIDIKLTRITQDDSCFKEMDTTKVGYCKIEITDTGTGIDHATVERVFEPFFTTKEVGKGTGLGLSIAHAIILAHHGKIMLKSQVGQGTTFTVILPVV